MKKTISQKFLDYLLVLLFRVRPFTRRMAKKIADLVATGSTVLEIGSGKAEADGSYYFSVKKYFDSRGVTFICSDRDASFGHRSIDVTTFDEENVYDHILCFHVLDDIYEWQHALLNLTRALRVGGTVHIILPVFNGFDLTADYYRFSEKLLRTFCEKEGLRITEFYIHGYRVFPFAYYMAITT